MSLFGESPPAHNKSIAGSGRGLFGDEPSRASKQQQQSSSLFADNDDGNANQDDSPWSLPTPKKQSRESFVKTLLPATQVPESYIDAFDTLLNAEENRTGGISLATVRKVLQSIGLTVTDQDKVLNIVLPTGQDSSKSLERGEFNVLLALIGLAQEDEELTLDGVDDRRKRLPEPVLPYLDQLKTAQRPAAQSTPPSNQQEHTNTPKQIPRPRQQSFGDDPWASPSGVKSIPPSTASHTLRPSADDIFTPSAVNGVPRTTSTFTTSSTNNTASYTSPDMSNAWGVPNGAGNGGGGFTEQSTLGGGFADTDAPRREQTQPSMAASVAIPKGTGELVTITTLPDKEGMFLFQHHNYEVKTIRRGSTVVRRYSDFVWLLDCLQKRYPFRRLPLLPPKRIQADGMSFLDKRRKGLMRFINALVQHPVLSQETLVVMFLTVPTELSVWRKQATISVQEEFVGKALPHDLEDSLPSNLPDLFEQVRTGVKRGAEIYIGLCNLMERLTKRNEAMAADNLKFSLALQTLTDGNNDMYAVDTNDVPLLNDGINSTAKHLASAQSLLDDEARAWDGGVVEDFKKIRDSMVSMRDLFDRRDRLAKDNIPQLERRIQNSENKLLALRQKASGTVKPGEMEKIESSITNDKESIVQQHARGVFIKECVRDEIITFQTTIFAQSHLHQDWAQERVKYAELQASNWRALVEDIQAMPVGE